MSYAYILAKKQIEPAYITSNAFQTHSTIPRQESAPHIQPLPMKTGTEEGVMLLYWISQCSCHYSSTDNNLNY